jgi:hypothetical protein
LFFIPCIFATLSVAVFPYFVKIVFILTGKENKIPVYSLFPWVTAAIFPFYFIVGYMSFSNLFCIASLLPNQFLISQFAHGIPEFLGFFLAGWLGLKICNDIKKASDIDGNITLMKIFPIFKENLKKYTQYLIIIILIIFAAAVIEVWITPQIWIQSFDNYFIANNITIPLINK